ncbi:MAG: hypothetical protein EXR70_16865 [Deltaproteobacteria bacterium]|nr:hypothetical protein [Deltaproteobacteria bacterium]
MSAQKPEKPTEITLSQDFVARQNRNSWISALIVFCFILFFILVGFAVDYAYLNAFTPDGAPLSWQRQYVMLTATRLCQGSALG